MRSAYADRFARDNLPPRDQWPEFRFDLPELQYPSRLNCAAELLDKPVTRGHGHRVALRSPDGECTYTQLFTQANRLGGGGEGFKVAMATLDVFRSTVGAAALGFARRALYETVEHAATRKLFGAPLGDLQLTQGAIADSATEVDAAALLVYRAAWTKDQGAARVTREAAMAKMYATEAAQPVIDRAVQLHGGRGVTKGEKVEELYREIRALRIYEGATEVQKIVIAREALRNRAARALAAE